MNRNEFLRTSGRWAIFGILAVFTGGFILRDRVSRESNCTKKGKCNGCVVLSSCELPEAIKTRNDGR